MDPKFRSLSPHKRFRLIHQEEEEEEEEHYPQQLPAKKRKESRDPLPVSDSNSSIFTATTDYCLPAKKRVRALNLDEISEKHRFHFGLNLESKEFKQEGTQPETESIVGEGVHSCEEDIDDGIVCAVCQSTDGEPSDPIVFCDGCDLMVHASCYGNPLVKGIPEGDWFCTQCSVSRTCQSDKDFACCLCPIKGGAMKPTSVNSQWAHIVCALFVPEVFFLDPEGREGIDCSQVLKRRWLGKCYLCKKTRGCVIDCSELKCPLAFHITCGLSKGLCIEYNEGTKKGAVVAGFCKSHTDLWEKQQQTGKYKIVARED